MHQDVLRSYQELRGDLRDLTLRVETLEQSWRSQGTLHANLIDLRVDFDRMRGATNRFAQDQAQTMSSFSRISGGSRLSWGMYRLDSQVLGAHLESVHLNHLDQHLSHLPNPLD